MAIRIYLSINILNRLNASAKRQRLAKWIQKQDSYVYCLQESHFRSRDTYRLKVRGWKKVFHANTNQRKARVPILISVKTDFKITLQETMKDTNDQGIDQRRR